MKTSVPTVVGAYAETLVVALAMFALAGLGWGFWRPAVSGTIVEGGGIEVTDPAVMNGNREFATFGVMVFCFLALGFVLALWVIRRRSEFLSPLFLVWGACCAAVGTVTFYVAGTKLALWRVGMPNLDDLGIGSTITYLPEVGLGIAALVAPLMFVLIAWCIAVIQPAPVPVEDTGA